MEESCAATGMDKRLSVACGEINLLPVELIGTILSYVSSARHVARASVTCRKWREAVKFHVHKLKFFDSDFKSGSNSADSDDDVYVKDQCRDSVIVEAVLQADYLSDLCISYADNGATMNSAVVLALLKHTKNTLRSLTLLTPCKPKLHILEKLACCGSTLQHLVWGPACVSGLNPKIHSIPSLVSLSLHRLIGHLNYEDFCLLFSMFPKLEHLSLHIIVVEGMPSHVEIQTSLKTLSMQHVVGNDFPATSLVVHGQNLESLTVVDMHLHTLTWHQTDGSLQACSLSIRKSSLERLVLSCNLQSMVVWNSKVSEVETCPLSSLLKFKLVEESGLTLAWPICLQVFFMACSRMHELHLLGASKGQDIVDVNTIASLFPCLHILSLDFQHSFFGESAEQPPPAFKKVVRLELHTVMQHTNHVLFAEWILKFLSHCPSLRRLVLMLEGPRTSFDDDGHQIVGRLASLLINRMHVYPLVDVKFEFASRIK